MMEKNKEIKLSVKHQRFADEILKGTNQTAAYKMFYTPKNDNVAAVRSSELVRNSKVSSYIESKKAKLVPKSETEIVRVLREIARIAFSDPRKIFTDAGTPKDINDLDDDVAAAIGGIEVIDYFEEDAEGKRKQVGYIKKYKFWDKNAALDKLMRYLAAYKDPGTKDNPLHVYTADLSKLPLDELVRIRKNPELALAARNN